MTIFYMIEFFDKTFAEYEEGFDSIGKYHCLTHQRHCIGTEFTLNYNSLQAKGGSVSKSSTSSPLMAATDSTSPWPTLTTRPMWLSMTSLRFSRSMIRWLWRQLWWCFRLVQETAMSWQWEGSTKPNPPLETPCGSAMGKSLPPSKIQNYKKK